MKWLTKCLLLLAAIPVAHAGRMPETMSRVENIGGGYLKLYEKEAADNGNYHIVHSYDVKRLVSHNHDRKCYLFYFTGAELLKIIIDTQNCEAIVKEITQSNKH